MKKQFHLLFFLALSTVFFQCTNKQVKYSSGRAFNGEYSNEYLNRVAFPIGGMGTGMICLEGTGAFSHVSLRHKPDLHKEPLMFAAVSVKGIENGTKVLEGPVQDWKVFGNPVTGNGAGEHHYGFPRFEKASFQAKFPFGEITLNDADIPLETKITGWNPFIPSDADNSSLPVGGFEYSFKNTSSEELEVAFSFHSENIMKIALPRGQNGDDKSSIAGMKNGFLLKQDCRDDNPHYKGDFAIFTDNNDAIVDLSWFRGGWFDGRTVLWKNLTNHTFQTDTTTINSPGASLYVPMKLASGEEKTVKLMMAWYVPHSSQRSGLGAVDEKAYQAAACCPSTDGCCSPDLSEFYYEPWYSGRFKNINEVTRYWSLNYDQLREKSDLFSSTFYSSDLPGEVIEAVGANLTILKTLTVLRQKDGRLWCYEGCGDDWGCCPGSCTHVWNYAQAIPHLFPSMERTLRETEFMVSQDERGHQNFRSTLPIQPAGHGFHAAADGQLGGIMKMHREWRISGDTEWMKSMYPQVKQSLDYCIATWDPKHKGIVEEPHHNTYDIEFWGPDGMCTSFYLGALKAIIEMGNVAGDDISLYTSLLEKGRKYLENDLFDGEYFIQKIQWEGLEAEDPVTAANVGIHMNYSDEAVELLKKEGPKYQYGIGCLSDGILGCWIGKMCGLDEFVDAEKVTSHLNAVHKYNLKTDLSDHINPQRPSFGMGKDGGLLLCSWPKGGALSLPFVYSNEVWTGIEYQVASHLILMGEIEKGLEIVREVRKRYDGRIRNPYNEYECGSWYARALASYGLIESMTGIRYDAIDKTLNIDSKVGNDFQCFIAVDGGWGLAGLKNGKPFIDVKYGDIDVDNVIVSGKEVKLD